MLHCCNVCGEWWRTEITRKEREMSPDWCMCAPWSPYMLNKSLINPPNIHFSSSAVLYRSFRMSMVFTNGAWRVRKSIHVRIVVFGDFITIILFLLDFNCFWAVFGVELRCLAVITTRLPIDSLANQPLPLEHYSSVIVLTGNTHQLSLVLNCSKLTLSLL